MPLDAVRKAQLLPVNVKLARKILKENNYTYNRTTKRWELINLSALQEIKFDDDEIAVLRNLAQQMIKGNKDITQNDFELYKRAKSLSKSVRNRKTFVLNKDIAQQIDELSLQTNLDKSDLLEIALIDFLEKYCSI